MNKFWLVFKFTYRQKVCSVSFVSLALILVIGVVGLLNFDNIKQWFVSEEVSNVAIVTNNAKIYQEIKNNNELLNPKVKFHMSSESDALKNIQTNDISRFYIIKENEHKDIESKLIYKGAVEESEKVNIQLLLSKLQFEKRANDYGLSIKQIEKLGKSNVIITEKIKSDTAYSSKEAELIQYIVYFSIAVMFIIILSYSNQAALEIATEKNSKVMEMILTSISPLLHLWGKILSLIAVALTQLGVVIATILICCLFDNDIISVKGMDTEVNLHIVLLILISIIYIFIGLATYIIFAMIIGAMTKNLENINQAVMPINVLLFIPIYLIIFNIDEVNDSLIKLTSYIPFFSPFTMLFRMTSRDVNVYELLLSLVLAIAMIILLSYIASRSYKESLLAPEVSFSKIIKKTIRREK
ncbi:hypothetical protein BFR38_01270 [Brochothrix thermosphacta]|uniref:ABC transporter permease n=1 Tax=Brochothrix thermosphacta TaxID=2756 RepID=UPI00083F9184|nr:ABC transporter permease [Brochothrix thermosphacta]ODJ56579.1 hypothetical protein BFR38_01270 [Brochothrix thermosphacta]ODJ58017.1 hypothetical protein BFR42_04700 [Brochothrix thermosphacta]